MDAAAKLLASPDPSIRLTAAWIRARGGDEAGETALLEMLGDDSPSLGFRGMAAKRLARLNSSKGHAAVIRLAEREVEIASAGRKIPEREGLRWSLLEALAVFGGTQDFDVARDLYKATGLRAPARSIGLFGRAEALPLLREALPRHHNAAWVIDTELAIARSGGRDGIAFTRELLHQATKLGTVEGQIDLEKEDPLSGRLGGHLLWDLGAHPSDRQFFSDIAAILKPSACTFCGAAWGALARIGIQDHEAELSSLAESLGRGRIDDALRVLVYDGALAEARALAKRTRMEPTAEAYVAIHEKGLDRKWFPLAGSDLD